jgi:hypothetical protein
MSRWEAECLLHGQVSVLIIYNDALFNRLQPALDPVFQVNLCALNTRYFLKRLSQSSE